MSKKKNAHGTKKVVEFEGVKWDSNDEYEYYRDIIIPKLEKGLISDLKLQPVYVLQSSFKKNGKGTHAIKFKGDFQYIEDGKTIVVDVKGFADNFSKIKRKLFDYNFPDITLIWESKSKKHGVNGWIDYDLLQKIRREEKRKKQAK